MRSGLASLVVVGALTVLIVLLMREGTDLWHLATVGAVAGSLVGGIRWGRRGAMVGAAVGGVVGLVAAVLYLPFWLIFTLPPHPKVDF